MCLPMQSAVDIVLRVLSARLNACWCWSHSVDVWKFPDTMTHHICRMSTAVGRFSKNGDAFCTTYNFLSCFWRGTEQKCCTYICSTLELCDAVAGPIHISRHSMPFANRNLSLNLCEHSTSVQNMGLFMAHDNPLCHKNEVNEFSWVTAMNTDVCVSAAATYDSLKWGSGKCHWSHVSCHVCQFQFHQHDT